MSAAIAIIVAAGSGSRMKTSRPKPLLPLADGSPMVAWSMRAFLKLPVVSSIVVVVPVDYREEFEQTAELFDESARSRMHFVIGGASRKASVANGLAKAKELASGEDAYVLIHDGARPFVTSSVIEDVIALVQEKKAVTVVMPQVDSLKEVRSDGCIARSLDRSALVAVQTPQAFSLSLLEQAHAAGSNEATDDAVLVEAIHPVHVVYGEASNRKVTTPDDYDFARYFSQREMGISRPS